MRRRQNGISRDPGAIDRRKLAAAIWHGQNSEQPTFVNVGTGLELFALESLSAYVKNIALGVTKILAVDHLPLFFGTPVTMFGSECMYKCPAAPLVRRAVAKGCRERWMSLSVTLALGGGNRVIRTQRICWEPV